MIVKKHYENLKVLHENTMPARAYYIPSSERMDNLVKNRQESDRFVLLNGNWKFKYYESIYDLKEEFYKEGFDAEDYDEIKVPSAWQMLSYDNQQYTNVKYPIPFDPPYVPVDNPCGTYIYDFIYSKENNDFKSYLNFEGVDSSFCCWLNGKYIGYSQVPHMTSEFDVSDVIVEGKNRLSVLVMKWSDGTYLEDQDKFRMSGIIRDVYILNRPQQAIYDYFIKTEIVNEKNEAPEFSDNEKLTGNVKIDFTYFDKDIDTKVEIFDKAGNKVLGGNVCDKSFSFSIENPVLWSHENPYLYTVVFSTDNEVITDRIGFRKIEIKNSIVYLNGKKIKFRGVNRHESDPVTGPVISIEQLIKDLCIIRQHNFTAIRTSHYPNVPYFYQLCDEYGFLVCDEADIEAHGPCLLYRKEDTEYNHFKRWNEQLADDPAWEEAIVDRVRLMLMRDKNRPCVVIWSMGNESAYGCNFEKALKFTKEFDTSRITQYESSRYRDYDKTYDFSNLDLYSRMYPSMEEMDEYFTRPEIKPFMLIEYSHSMGNGPGDFEDYFQYIENNDHMMGGFIWEFCDHAIYKGKSEASKDMYYYGGDHGEVVNDSNFCMDGLVYPDRTPHTGIKEYKNVNRPARVVSYDENSGEIMLHNYLTFTRLQDFAEIKYELSVDGNITEYGNINDVDVAPLSDGKAKLSLNVPDFGKTFLRVIYTAKNSTELIDAGHSLGFDEILIKNKDGRNGTVAKLLGETGANNGSCLNSMPGADADANSMPGPGADANCKGTISVEETDSNVVIKGSGFIYSLSKKTGLFDEIQNNGEEYFDRPSEINVWRAPTDNDIVIKEEWKKACYHMAYIRAYETRVTEENGAVNLAVKASVGAPTVQKFIDLDITYSINEEGTIFTKIHAIKDEEFPELPRFGVRMFLNKNLNCVKYFGMGPYESYEDKKRASYHGIFSAGVSEMTEDYIRPQENGSHTDTDYVELSGLSEKITVASFKPFSFNVGLYTQEELETKAHNFELTECGSTVLCIDARMDGIGSNSCGPALLEKYRFDDTEFELEYGIVFNK